MDEGALTCVTPAACNGVGHADNVGREHDGGPELADHEGGQRAADEDTLHDVADGVPHHSHAEDRDGACGQQVAVRCTASNCLSNSRLGRPSDGRITLMRMASFRWQRDVLPHQPSDATGQAVPQAEVGQILLLAKIFV